MSTYDETDLPANGTTDDEKRTNDDNGRQPDKYTESTLPSHYVGVGASAGGLEAIETFFTHMSANSGMAFVVIQHLSPDYKSLMVELLSKKTDMDVFRAEEGMLVEPNKVYLIPPKKNLTIFHGKLLLSDQDSARGLNLPIDLFFQSLAEDQGRKSVAIVLSGTGSDGTRGVRSIKEMNGMVMVQSEESAKFDGMPRAAASTGLADYILPPEDMPAQLMSYAKHPYIAKAGRSEALLSDEDGITRLFAMLRDKTKVDFTHYKQSTVTRRIERRITVTQSNNLKDYVRYMQSYPGEVMALYRELLIGVTSFYRDAESFAELATKYLPEIFRLSENREVRFWVVGCSTGEEAYTLAILARETMDELGISRDVKIFATDLDRDAIMVASAGIYPESIMADLNSRLVTKYFYRKDDKLQITRNVREMVVFAQHNVLKDPPFTNIDLISCRNLLIYLQPVLQQKALEMFNFSLNDGGILFLGSSETVGDMSGTFETLHSRHKIYRSRGKADTGQRIDNVRNQSERHVYLPRHMTPHNGEVRGVREDRFLTRFLDALAETYVPLAVVVNDSMEVLHTLGDTEGFFKLPSGRAVYDISKMAAKDLAIPLATGIQKVFRDRKEVVYTNIRLQNIDESHAIRMRIVPMPGRKGQESLAVVFLEKVQKPTSAEKESAHETFDVSVEAQQRIEDLEQELQFVKENLQATIEELETANEELQATNEELLASNEELQSTNEELQSTNEELFTVNAEYQQKIIELTELNNDVDNLLNSSNIGQLLLDENLDIRRFNHRMRDAFHLNEKDIGRSIRDIAHLFDEFDPIEAIRQVQESNEPYHGDLHTSKGKWLLTRVIPYNIGPEAFAGVVMTIVDITELKQARDQLERSEEAAQAIMQYTPAGVFLYEMDEDGRLVLIDANSEAQELTGIKLDDWKGKTFDEIWPNARDEGISRKFEKVLQTGKPYSTEELDYSDDRVKGAYRIRAFRLPAQRLAVSFEDVLELKRMEENLRRSEEQFRRLFETMAQGVVYQDADGNIIMVNRSAERILGLTADQLMGKTSMDPRWKAVDKDGNSVSGDKHPAMVALSTGKP
ncbi:PAS domain S-box protein, partial [bacterium]|nr:PAS domain S-box protein [bacterium]